MGDQEAPQPQEVEPPTSKLERAIEALRRQAAEAVLEERMRAWLLENPDAMARIVLEA